MFSILAFGDSITFGSGVNPKHGWVYYLKEDFEAKDDFNFVYNLGIPGDTSTGLLERIETEAGARVDNENDIILIAIGTNDARCNPQNLQTQPEDFRENINKIITIAKKYTKKVVVLGLSPVDENMMPFEGTYFTNKTTEQFNNILKSQANKHNVAFCDIFNQLINKNYAELLSDGLHPNEEGYKLMYKIIKRDLEGLSLTHLKKVS